MIAWVAARMTRRVRRPHRLPVPDRHDHPGSGADRGAHQRGRRDQRAVHAGSNAGSSVVRGNLLVLPIGEDALLYVEPIFLQAQGAPFPEFVRVIMADQDRVAFAETVEEGLAQLLGEAEPPPPEEPEPTEPGESPEPDRHRRISPGELPTDVAELVTEASRLYDQAQRALAAGDLGTYQDRIDELAEVLEALEAATGRPGTAP